MALGMFEGFGVELEYMIVDRQTLAVRPVADEILRAAAGGKEFVSDHEVGGTGIGWSNELALHVIELKTAEPVRSLAGLAPKFDDSVASVNALLAPTGGRLMPSAMHPLMDPLRELRLWPHDNSPIYAAFDRIFGCTGHGWANLQAVHLNLPFDGDDQFGRLHAAIRLLLPILPALAASSPIMEGKPTGVADNRLAVYRTNARRIPSVSGRVIPEPVFTRAAYEGDLLAGIYRDLEPLDPDGLLREEWVNARGAIARFSRGSIEIRVLDVQECPAADVAVCGAIVAVLTDLIAQRWQELRDQQDWPIEPLERILTASIHSAERTVIDDPAYLAALGLKSQRCSAAELWAHLIHSCVRNSPLASEWLPALDLIQSQGTLSTRIARSTGDSPTPDDLRRVYADLGDCLAAGRMFHA